MADDLQKLIDSELKDRVVAPSDIPQREDEDVPLSAEEKKAKEDLRQEIEGEGGMPARKPVLSGEVHPPTPQEIAEAIRLHQTRAPENKEISAEIIPRPKTIADLLHLEAEVAKNPPKAAPEGTAKIREGLKNITVAQKPESSILKRIRTLKSDTEDAMTSGKSTFIGIATAQLLQNKKDESSGATLVDPEPIRETEAPKKSRISFTLIAIFLGLILILTAFGGVGYVLYLRKSPVSEVTDNLTSNSLIPTQFEIVIETNRKNASYLKAAVAAEKKNAPGTLNDLGNISFVVSKDVTPPVVLTTNDFITTLGMHPPTKLLRTLSPSYMLGIHRFPENQAFLILKTDTYETARDALLEWESTSLEEDVGKLLRSPSDFDFNNASSTVVTLQPFKDMVLKNKDSRVLTNSEGKVLFFYTFIDRSYIVFASDPETLQAVIVGLAGRKTIQ
jgi:hypothetical protein